MSLRSLEAERIDLGGICRDRTHRSTYCASVDRIHSSMERPPCVVEGLLVNLTQNINRQQSRLMQRNKGRRWRGYVKIEAARPANWSQETLTRLLLLLPLNAIKKSRRGRG